MDQTKGLVMKITDRYMVVMCDDGIFRNLPLPEQIPSVGERIGVPLRKKKQISLSWLSAVAAIFLIFLGSIIWFQLQPKYSHVVAIDINPSLELYLNSEGRVMQARSLNQDAETLLKNLSVDSLILNDAIQLVLRKSVDLGYIKKEKENLIMVTVAKLKGKSEIIPKTIESLVTKTLQSENIDGFVRVEQADKSLYKESKQKGLSLNKLTLEKQAEQRGIPMDFEKAASDSIQQVLQKAGVSKEEFFVPISTNTKKDQKEKTGDQSSSQKNEREQQQKFSPMPPGDGISKTKKSPIQPNSTSDASKSDLDSSENYQSEGHDTEDSESDSTASKGSGAGTSPKNSTSTSTRPEPVSTENGTTESDVTNSNTKKNGSIGNNPTENDSTDNDSKDEVSTNSDSTDQDAMQSDLPQIQVPRQ
ncbi:anti-sigma factor domain-containing protein [Effusibacillus consociatus]|uniref:Anti-sigma factor domain-containing protein n=1 Tax=Effusibacillus consociatus TaxID=1117041 RepID=A0ABV9Q4M7_9BACL